MSRHRFIKTLDLDDELDDFDGDQEVEDDYDPNEDPRMRESLAEARDILSQEFTDREIQDSLWYTYYDVEKTVNFLLKEQKPSQSVHAQHKDNKAKCMQSSRSIARAFFADAPWLDIPNERRASISIEPRYSRGGLLGGSSKEAPKASKLAALAAARRKKANAPSGEEIKSPSSPAAILDRLSKSKSEETRNRSDTSSEQAASDSQQSLSSRLRKYPNKSKAKAEPSPKFEKQPETSMPAPASVEPEEPQAVAAEPSIFASTMLGANPTLTSSVPFASYYDPLQLSCDISEANLDPFAGPSPDDVVANAQNAAKGMKKKEDSKGQKAKSNGIDTVTNGVAKAAISEPTRGPPKSKNLNVLEEYGKATKKKSANFVVIGHVDAGKSTLMGRLLWDLKVVDQRTVDKYRKEAEKIGKSSFALAWVLDQGSDEREHGVTIDIATNKFETDKTAFTILDAPGHKDFVPNMIAGASQADFAILVLDASTGSFESGLKGQTKEHALLVRSMGVQRLIVAVNKLDTVGWSQDRFDEISQQTSAFLAAAGFQQGNISFVPCSGLSGDNISSKSNNCPWYNGLPLLSLLESSEPSSQNRALTGPLRLPISQVFAASVQYPLSVNGRITAGSVQVGDKVTLVPSNQTGYVKALAVDDEPADWAVAGQNTTLHLSSDVEVGLIKAGDIACPADRPVILRNNFTLKVLAFEHLMPSFCNVVIGRLDMPARINKLIAVLDKSTGKVAEGKNRKKPRIIKPGEAARLEVSTEAEGGLPIEEGARVVLRAEGETTATGVVESF